MTQYCTQIIIIQEISQQSYRIYFFKKLRCQFSMLWLLRKFETLYLRNTYVYCFVKSGTALQQSLLPLGCSFTFQVVNKIAIHIIDLRMETNP